ncbi:MAG: hypothetical protein J5680_02315 [Neisseriaceae bacterium]|nr:hypothetical protein [Neisseriaceae bacterium]
MVKRAGGSVGWATCCPRGFITFSGSLKLFNSNAYGVVGGLKTHPITKPAVLRWACQPTKPSDRAE